MPSYYDEKAKCRVGEMDEKQFYAETDKDNGQFFKLLVAAWTKAGGSLKWGAGGAGLRAKAGGKEVGVCFLAPKFAGKQDRIELSCTALKKQLSGDVIDILHCNLRSAAGASFKGTTMVSLVNPGKLSEKAQKVIVKSLLAVASNS